MFSHSQTCLDYRLDNLQSSSTAAAAAAAAAAVATTTATAGQTQAPAEDAERTHKDYGRYRTHLDDNSHEGELPELVGQVVRVHHVLHRLAPVRPRRTHHTFVHRCVHGRNVKTSSNNKKKVAIQEQHSVTTSSRTMRLFSPPPARRCAKAAEPSTTSNTPRHTTSTKQPYVKQKRPTCYFTYSTSVSIPIPTFTRRPNDNDRIDSSVPSQVPWGALGSLARHVKPTPGGVETNSESGFSRQMNLGLPKAIGLEIITCR